MHLYFWYLWPLFWSIKARHLCMYSTSLQKTDGMECTHLYTLSPHVLSPLNVQTGSQPTLLIAFILSCWCGWPHCFYSVNRYLVWTCNDPGLCSVFCGTIRNKHSLLLTGLGDKTDTGEWGCFVNMICSVSLYLVLPQLSSSRFFTEHTKCPEVIGNRNVWSFW